MINQEKMPWSIIEFSQPILLWNVWRSVWRICMLILGLKGLRLYCRHWNCFLLTVATDGKDRHGLKLETVGPRFSCFNAMPAKITNTNTVKFQTKAPPCISPSKYKPPKIVTQKTLRYIPLPNISPPGGLYFEFALEYKVKQSKNGKFPSQ